MVRTPAWSRTSTPPQTHPRTRPVPTGGWRPGAILVLTALLLVVFCGFLAFGLDVGYMLLVRTQLQTAADAAAMAATDALRQSGSVTSAKQAAYDIAEMNHVGGSDLHLDVNSDVVFGRRTYDSATSQWVFQANQTPYDSVRVQARRTGTGNALGVSPDGAVGLFFGPVLGVASFESAASATATYLPRDIALAIDLSGSMHYDSSIVREPERGVSAVDDSLEAIWQNLGSHTYGNMNNWSTLQTITSTNYTTVKSTLGITSVAYPYAAGSWNEYLDFVSAKSGASAKRQHIIDRGYRYKYGLKTFTDYLQWIRSRYTDTPPLPTSPEQPIKALKDAVDIMMDYLATLNTEEWVALATYDDTARTETISGVTGLTSNLAAANARMQQLGAGHYSRQTNIGDGIKQARLALTGATARPQARKVMVLMTDGEANRPSGNITSDKNYAVQEAQYAADQDITIYTVSFGALSDQALMGQIATIGHGTHYHVEGYDVAQYTADLQQVFINISSNRPLALTN